MDSLTKIADLLGTICYGYSAMLDVSVDFELFEVNLLTVLLGGALILYIGWVITRSFLN